MLSRIGRSVYRSSRASLNKVTLTSNFRTHFRDRPVDVFRGFSRCFPFSVIALLRAVMEYDQPF